MLNLFKQALAKLQEGISSVVASAEKYMSGDVFDACMATVVMVGWADGDFDASEKMKALAFVKAHPTMKGRTADEVKKAFEKYDDVMTLDVAMGRTEAMKAITAVAGADDEAKTLIVQVGVLIGGADGDFDDNEKRIVREICSELGVSPSNFGL